MDKLNSWSGSSQNQEQSPAKKTNAAEMLVRFSFPYIRLLE